MFGLSLDPETSERLSRLAQEAGQSEVDFAGAALREYLLELDDAALAQSR